MQLFSSEVTISIKKCSKLWLLDQLYIKLGVLVFIEKSDIVGRTQNLKKNLPLGFDGTKCKTLLFDNFKS